MTDKPIPTRAELTTWRKVDEIWGSHLQTEKLLNLIERYEAVVRELVATDDLKESSSIRHVGDMERTLDQEWHDFGIRYKALVERARDLLKEVDG